MMGSIILSSAHAHSVFCHSRILLTPGMCRSALSCSACMVLLHGHLCRHRRWGYLVGLSPGTMQDMLPAFACCRFFSPYGFTLKPSPRRSGCRLPCASNSSCKPPMLAPRMAVAHPRVAMKPRRANRHFAVLPSTCWLSLRARWLSAARSCSAVSGTAHDSANLWWNAALR